MHKIKVTALYADLGLDVLPSERFRLIATGDELSDESGEQMSDKASQLAIEYIDALAIDDGALLMDEVFVEQFKNCPDGFCPDIRAAYESGHGCVVGGGTAHKNDSIKAVFKGTSVFSSDTEVPFLVENNIATESEF